MECLFYWRDLWDSPTQWPMGLKYKTDCPICYALNRDSRLGIYILNTSLTFLLSRRPLAVIQKVQSPSKCYELINTSWETAFRRMPQNTLNIKSTLFMVNYGPIRQQDSIRPNVHPDICRHIESLGHSESTDHDSWYIYFLVSLSTVGNTRRE